MSAPKLKFIAFISRSEFEFRIVQKIFLRFVYVLSFSICSLIVFESDVKELSLSLFLFEIVPELLSKPVLVQIRTHKRLINYTVSISTTLLNNFTQQLWVKNFTHQKNLFWMDDIFLTDLLQQQKTVPWALNFYFIIFLLYDEMFLFLTLCRILYA